MRIGHEKQASKNGAAQLPVHMYLVYLLVCTFLLTGVSFSRYISKANGNDGAQVAAGIVEVALQDDGKIVLDLADGTSTGSLDFDVSNHDQNSVSEVAIRYDVVVKLDEALPNGVTMELDNKSGTSNDGKSFAFEDMGTFEAGEGKVYSHTLTFAGKHSTISEKFVTGVIISVRAEQID